MFGHSEGNKVAEAMMKSLEDDGFQLSKLCALSSDGPNVNKTIWRQMQKMLTDAGHAGLLQFTTCIIHVIHSGFHAGLSVFGSDVQDLTVDLHCFFILSAARREDFHAVQRDLKLKEELFVRHVPSRWLTFGIAVKRIQRQWPAICQYFSSLQKLDAQQQPTSSAYKRITAKCQSKQLLVTMHFLDEIVPVFEELALFLQAEAPQIHLLYNKLASLVQRLLLRCVNPELLMDKKPYEYKDIDIKAISNQLADNDIVLGETV